MRDEYTTLKRRYESQQIELSETKDELDRC